MIRNGHFIWLIEVSTENRTEKFCNNALRALMLFFVLFSLIPRSTENMLDSFFTSCILDTRDKEESKPVLKMAGKLEGKRWS